MKRTNNGYELSTGRKLNPNRGILGLVNDGSCEPWESKLTEGLDSGIPEGTTEDDPDAEIYGRRDLLTPGERREIAEYMIALWLEWGDVTENENGSSSKWDTQALINIAKRATQELRQVIRDRDAARSSLAAEKEISAEFQTSLARAKDLLSRCVIAAYSPTEILGGNCLQRTLPERISRLLSQVNRH